MAGLALCHYVALALLPIHMSLERSTSINLNQSHPWLMFALLALVIALILAVIFRRSDPALLFGLGWFAICIAPFCLFQNYQGIAERFVYLPSLGIAATLVALCTSTNAPKSAHR